MTIYNSHKMSFAVRWAILVTPAVTLWQLHIPSVPRAVSWRLSDPRYNSHLQSCEL